MRRWVTWSVVAVVILGAGCWIGKPWIEDWRLRTFGCDGVLDAGAVKTLAPDGALVDKAESTHNPALHSMNCVVGYDSDSRRNGLRLTAWTRPDAVDAELQGVSVSRTGLAPAPGGLPGFALDSGSVYVEQDCPDLPRTARGAPAQLLARVDVPPVDKEHTQDAQGLIVDLVNHASAELDCGARPLKADPHAAPMPFQSDDWGNSTEDPTSALKDAAGTSCDGLIRTVPSPAETWRARSFGDKGPLVGCELSRPGGENAENSEDEDYVLLYANYGEWADLASLPVRHTSAGMRATATCEGRRATLFGLAGDKIAPERRRAVFTAFVKGQEAERHCTAVDLNAEDDAAFD